MQWQLCGVGNSASVCSTWLHDLLWVERQDWWRSWQPRWMSCHSFVSCSCGKFFCDVFSERCCLVTLHMCMSCSGNDHTMRYCNVSEGKIRCRQCNQRHLCWVFFGILCLLTCVSEVKASGLRSVFETCASFEPCVKPTQVSALNEDWAHDAWCASAGLKCPIKVESLVNVCCQNVHAFSVQI